MNMRLYIFVLVLVTVNCTLQSTEYQDLIDLSDRLHDWELKMKNIGPHSGISIIAGLSGSGKSTLINFANHVPLKAVQNYTDYTISIERVNKTHPPCCWIGGQYASETAVPYVLGNFVDMPGFDDNRGPLAEIRNAFTVNAFVNGSNPIRFLICIPQYYLEPYQRAERMAELLRYLQPLASLNSLRLFEEAVNVIITSATNTDTAVTKFHLSKMIVETPHLSPQAKRILSIWTKPDFNRLFYLKRPSSVGLFLPEDYTPIHDASSKHVTGLTFAPRGSLSMCQYIHSVHEKLKKDINDISSILVAQVRVSSPTALIKNCGYAQAEFIRGRLASYSAEIQRFSDFCEATQGDGCCCGGGGRGSGAEKSGRYISGKGSENKRFNLVDIVTDISVLFAIHHPLDADQEETTLSSRLKTVCDACEALHWLTRRGMVCPVMSGQQTSFSDHLQAAVQSLVQLLDRQAKAPEVSGVSAEDTFVPAATTKVRITGNIVGMSDILSYMTQQVSSSSTSLTIHVVAKQFFLFDHSLRLPSTSIMILAKKCVVAGNTSIDLSGKSSGQCDETSGRPGRAGAPGGHFFTSCVEWFSLEYVDIRQGISRGLVYQQQHLQQQQGAGGGEESSMIVLSRNENKGMGHGILHVISNGGAGEGGCPGVTGRDGAPGVAGHLMNGRPHGGMYLHEVKGGILARKHLYRSGVFGTPGGNGQKGGKGGRGGLPGKVTFSQHLESGSMIVEQMVRITSQQGRCGVDGEGGKGGRGGTHVVVYEKCVFVTNKNLYNCAVGFSLVAALSVSGWLFHCIYVNTGHSPEANRQGPTRVYLFSLVSSIAATSLVRTTFSWASTLLAQMRVQSLFHVVAVLSALLATFVGALKLFVIDRFAAEDVEWTGWFGEWAGESYEVPCAYYKAPDGLSGDCCNEWPTGEGSPVQLKDLAYTQEIVIGDDILY